MQVQALGGEAAVDSIPLGPIQHPQEEGNAGGSGEEQAPAAAATAAAANGRSGEQREQQQLAAAQRQQYIEQQQVEQDLEQQRQRRRPAVVLGDGVSEFTEIAAAAGVLGRFPGSQVMPLVRQFVGLEAVS